MKRLICLAVLASALVASRADAGIIIMTNGKVFIGRIDAEDMKDAKGVACAKDVCESITMHSPQQYKGQPPLRGEMIFPRHDVRWFDPASDEPTDEYMRLYAKANVPLDPKWYALYVAPWLEAQDNSLQVAPLVNLPESFKAGKLSTMSLVRKWGSGNVTDEASIRRPAGWSTNEVDGITIFVADTKGTDGFTPRIHFFAVEAAIGQITDQLSWIKQEIEKASSGTDAFDVKGDNVTPKEVRGGRDVEWTTTTRRNGKAIKALRAMKFRQNRAYFVTCYANEKDFESYQLLYQACVSSLQINEGGNSTATNDAMDVGNVNLGQTYVWRSQNVPDDVVWEITLKDPTAIRHKTTRTNADGSKKTTEEPETVGPVDPIQRLNAICSSQVAPEKKGKESITVSGQTYDCDIYEATANGKKYKLWLTRKFPMEIRLLVDGQLMKELCEVK
jgi:hypothetical protein